jgi:signal peptidase
MISNTTQLLLTKGDNNDGDDVILYNGTKWIERKHIVGKVSGWVYSAYSIVLDL